MDGSKLKAVNSIDRNLNLQTLTDKLKRIEEKVQKYLNEIEETDRKEGEAQVNKGRQGTLRDRVQKLREKTGLYSRLLSNLRESGQNEVSLTDPDSRLMKDRGKLDVCYNTHAAVLQRTHDRRV